MNSFDYGGKVKIKYDNFKDRNFLPNFRDFIEQNKDIIFDAYIDREHGYKRMYVLLQDINIPKFLFDEEDLIFLEEEIDKESVLRNDISSYLIELLRGK